MTSCSRCLCPIFESISVVLGTISIVVDAIADGTDNITSKVTSSRDSFGDRGCKGFRHLVQDPSGGHRAKEKYLVSCNGLGLDRVAE